MQAAHVASSLTPFDLHLHAEGTHHESYRMLGAHPVSDGEVRGVRFAVWAPNAEQVTVIGDFNQWSHDHHAMQHRDSGSVGGLDPGAGARAIITNIVPAQATAEVAQEKSDPYGFQAEAPPRTASTVLGLATTTSGPIWRGWRLEASATWLARTRRSLIGEAHLESWRRKPSLHESAELPRARRRRIG